MTASQREELTRLCAETGETMPESLTQVAADEHIDRLRLRLSGNAETPGQTGTAPVPPMLGQN